MSTVCNNHEYEVLIKLPLANTTAVVNGPIASTHGGNSMMPLCAATRLQFENPLS